MKKTQTNTVRSRSHRNRLTIQMRSDAGSRLGAVAPREEVLFGNPCLTLALLGAALWAFSHASRGSQGGVRM